MKDQLLVHIGGRKRVSPTSILMLKADINYTIIYFEDGTYCMTSTTIGVLESRLQNLCFFRLNRSVLINLEYMIEFEKDSAQIKMENNEVFKIARRRTRDFADLTYKHNFSANNKNY